MYTLLFIDDDIELLRINQKNFTDRGFDVRCAANAKEGLELLATFSPDCILLDVMMPGMNGFDACRKIRKQSKVPIIFLTGRVSEDDKVNGLLLGADDYIEKPYSFRELEARIAVNIRRNQLSTEERLLFPPLEIDVAAHRVLVDKKDLNLSKQEYALLYFLITKNGRTVTYEQAGMYLWNAYRPEDRRSVMVTASRLRKKLESNPITARMVETVWGQGYRFVYGKGGAANAKDSI